MHKYTVALRISSAELDVAQVTTELGLNPTQTRIAGEYRSVDTVWDKTLWELAVFPESRSEWDSIEVGLAELLKAFAHQTKKLQEYSKNHDVYIWCGHFSSSFDGGPQFSPRLLKDLGDFGVTLCLETHHHS